MKKHLFTILIGATSMVASSPARAQDIVATHDAYGHTVWVASDVPKPQPKAANPAASGRVNRPACIQSGNRFALQRACLLEQ